MTNRLVIASNNRGKIAELTELLAPLGMTPIAQGELGVGEAEEPADGDGDAEASRSAGT